MKNTGFLLVLLLPLFCRAQTPAVPSAQQHGEYCVVTVLSAGNSYELSISDSVKKTDKEKMVKDTFGKVLKFKTFAASLDYMAQKRWTLITSTPGIANGFDNNIPTFIFKHQ